MFFFVLCVWILKRACVCLCLQMGTLHDSGASDSRISELLDLARTKELGVCCALVAASPGDCKSHDRIGCRIAANVVAL